MLLFVDESGTDHREAPYEVLGGIALAQAKLWPFIQDVQASEVTHFGVRLADYGVEIKGKKLLTKKKYRLASQRPEIEPDQRSQLAARFLNKSCLGETPSRNEFTAYGQACFAFCMDLLLKLKRYDGKVFASMVSIESPRPDFGPDFLRKDYSYLFERYFYYLEDIGAHAGLVVFDQQGQSRTLKEQMERYFMRTEKGRARSRKIVPLPFFVDSELTTAIQVADVIIYCLNWSYRLRRMNKPIRPELSPLVDLIEELIYVTDVIPEGKSRSFRTYSVTYINDLRTSLQRNLSEVR